MYASPGRGSSSEPSKQRGSEQRRRGAAGGQRAPFCRRCRCRHRCHHPYALLHRPCVAHRACLEEHQRAACGSKRGSRKVAQLGGSARERRCLQAVTRRPPLQAKPELLARELATVFCAAPGAEQGEQACERGLATRKCCAHLPPGWHWPEQLLRTSLQLLLTPRDHTLDGLGRHNSHAQLPPAGGVGRVGGYKPTPANTDSVVERHAAPARLLWWLTESNM